MLHPARAWRALPLAALAALTLTTAPAQAACPTWGCEDPEPMPIRPSAQLTGPATAVRTLPITLDATGSNGGEDGWGNAEEITAVAYDVDGVAGYEITGAGLTREVTFPKGIALGNRTVRVRVTSASGTDTDSHVINIQNRQPASAASPSDATPVVGQAVTFTGTASDEDSDSVGHQWNKGTGAFCDPFGGDASCLAGSFERSFDAPGTYTIVHRAHDSDGAHADASTVVTVRARPTAALSADANPAVAGEIVTFDAGASTGQGVRTYRWDVDGDPGNGFETGTGASPTLTMPFPAGTRAVRVQVADDEGVKKFLQDLIQQTSDFVHFP
jgi:hypothetical protein